MFNTRTELLEGVAAYYSEKLAQHGATPQGVDWNSEQAQLIRFDQLIKIIDLGSKDFSVNDIGCGYGALLLYLQGKNLNPAYLGVDISPEMIALARQSSAAKTRARFITSSQPDQIADYGIASGIFNVRLGETEDVWFDYIEATLDVMNRTSRRGFSFNCLTSYSDEEKKRSYLYYADPCRIFDLCKRRYSRQVALLHDYGLYEFTVLIRKM